MTRPLLLLAAALAATQLAACGSDSASLTAPDRPAASPNFGLSDVATGAAPVGAPITLTSALGAGICADYDAGRTTPGTIVQIWSCHGGSNQQFVWQPSGQITPAGNNAVCLDASGGQGRDGDRIILWPCNGGANQVWSINASGDVSGINGKCLDLDAGNTTNGTRLLIWACHGGPNQKWTATAVGATVTPAPTPPPSAAAPSDVGGTAELPRTYLETAMPAVTGRTIAVAADGSLQAALDAAQPGDQVVLAPGAVFVGNFLLRPKAGMTAGQWITVRSSGALPAEGTRVGPGDAAQMPKLQTPNNEAAVATTAGAQGWRLVGLEITAAPGRTWATSFVDFGSPYAADNAPGMVASRLVLDRSYVHGAPAFELRRCVALNSAASAIIDSYLGDCHSNSNESQAILGWAGPGPYKIVNNHLEGGHEVIMFGGNDPATAGVVPGDIELRRNHVTRPLNWRGVWQVKNLFELKNARRVLAEGNVFENNWADAQVGYAFAWWSVNQEGGCSWCTVQDVTFRYNRVLNTPQGFNLTASSGRGETALRRVTIAHNVITGVTGHVFLVNGGLAGVTIANNTGMSGSHNVYFATPEQPLPTFVFRDNVTGGYYTLFASGTGQGDRALAALQVPAGNVAGNVFAGGQTWNLPAGNAYAASADALGFASLGGGDLALAAASPFRTSGTGGSTPGADFTALNRMTSGVVR